MLSKPKISAMQLGVMLTVSRLFSMFTYKSRAYEIGAVTAGICIAVSMLISFLLFVPLFILIGKKSDVNSSDLGYINTSGFAKLFSFSMFVICIFLSVECLTHFTFFMSSTLYLSSTPVFFLLPILVVVVFICRKGIEAVARLSGMVFVAMAFSIILIAILSLDIAESFNIEPIKYDNFSHAVLFTLDKVAHTTEIIPFLILCENVKGSIKKSAIVFVVLTGIFLEIISFITITALGEYRKAILFPFYTLSAMSKNSLTDRMSLVFLVLWVFMVVIRLSIYFTVAVENVNHLMHPSKKIISNILCATLVFVFALFTCENIVSIDKMYKLILTGIPIILLAVFFPVVFIAAKKLRRGGESNE